MNINNYLTKKSEDLQKLQLLSQERQKHADNLFEKIRVWISDLPHITSLTERPTKIGVLNAQITLSAPGCKIWVRRALTKDKILLLIGKSHLEYLDNVWYYIDNDNKRQFSKDVFFEILVREIENHFPDSY